MPDDITKANFKKAHDKHATECFERWMRSPPVQLLVSLLPPGPAPEIVPTLMREAFFHGSHTCLSFLVDEFAIHIAKKGEVDGHD